MYNLCRVHFANCPCSLGAPRYFHLDYIRILWPQISLPRRRLVDESHPLKQMGLHRSLPHPRHPPCLPLGPIQTSVPSFPRLHPDLQSPLQIPSYIPSLKHLVPHLDWIPYRLYALRRNALLHAPQQSPGWIQQRHENVPHAAPLQVRHHWLWCQQQVLDIVIGTEIKMDAKNKAV